MPKPPPPLPQARRLLPSDPDWPRARLAELADPPSELRICGELPPLATAVAVVGTRYADADGLSFARALGSALAAAGCVVVSGGALGIDAAAHRGALEAGGPTVAVLAAGFDPPYPPAHRGLFREVAGQGALVSEQPDGTPPVRFSFLARNRLIAALAQSVVVVQAPLRSGALSTAGVGIRLNKPVFAVPYAPWDARGEGCLELLRRGARICTSYRDVLSVPAHGVSQGHDGSPSGLAGRGRDSLGQAPPEARPDGENLILVDTLDADEQAVLGGLSRAPKHPDELSATLGLPAMKVQRALLQLLLQGLAVERGSGRYARNPAPEQR
jgi:DNA processing protein